MLSASAGIEEVGAPQIRLRDAPMGAARLPEDVARSGAEFVEASLAAVERGDAAEDRSQGHALAHDPASRAVQERFIGSAARDLPLLRRVLLQTSADAAHRAAAAIIIGWAAHKQSAAPDAVRVVPPVPADPFVEWLRSPVWSDRNKGVLALDALSKSHDTRVLARLRAEALDPLVEMARRKSEGHAWPAYAILARMAGFTDEAALSAWETGDRERVIRSATAERP